MRPTTDSVALGVLAAGSTLPYGPIATELARDTVGFANSSEAMMHVNESISSPATAHLVEPGGSLVALGLTCAFLGALSGSFGLLLIKSGGNLEGHLPWYNRYRWMMGFVLQAVVSAITDTIAYSTCPLSLLTPLAGITMALATVWAALGIIQTIHEPVSGGEVATILLIFGGVTLTSAYGPHSVTHGDLDQLGAYMRQPGFIILWVLFSILIFGWTAILLIPQLRVLQPKQPVAHALLSAASAAACAGLTQIFLKIIAMLIPYAIQKHKLPVGNAWVWISLFCLILCACAGKCAWLHACMCACLVCMCAFVVCMCA